jgi:hypothetical protein
MRSAQSICQICLVVSLLTNHALQASAWINGNIVNLSSRTQSARVSINNNSNNNNKHTNGRRYADSNKRTRLYSLPNVDSMKAADMRRELEDYGISTKSFLEKRELMDALNKARAEGRQPKSRTTTATTTSTESASASSGGQSNREEELEKYRQEAMNMKFAELRHALKRMGISTNSFFEKSEFIRAYAEAKVDGRSSASGGPTGQTEQEYDPDYRDVVMQKMDARDPRLLTGTVIDVKATPR